ncbi:unnamed protein product, partial [Scytosiphon promiscuus]
MGGNPKDDDPAGLGDFLSWFERHGGSMTDIFLEDVGGEMSLSLFTGQALSRGQHVMSIPISLCMTVESAERSGLERVLQAHPDLMDTPDEVLALHLMAEKKKGEGSFWKEYLRTLPDDVDTPLRWLAEGAQDEFGLLDGTMVGILSKMMHAQVVKDWEEVHLPLVETYPEVLGELMFQDYLWAMSSIWSRSFDYLEPLADGSLCSRRAMVPVINAANHDPSAAESLSEMIEFQTEAEGVPNTTGDRENARGRLRVVAGRDYRAREQFFILYGRYSNAKLLYSYGFTLANNPYGGLDYWTRVPPTDKGLQWKQALLDENPLTASQTYDFSGTVRRGGWISPALLATVRVAQLTTDERPMAGKAFKGKMVSPRNEAASLNALLAGLRRKRTTMGNSADQSAVGAGDEAKLVISLQEELERCQRHRHREMEGEQKGKKKSGDTEAGSGGSRGGGIPPETGGGSTGPFGRKSSRHRCDRGSRGVASGVAVGVVVRGGGRSRIRDARQP